MKRLIYVHGWSGGPSTEAWVGALKKYCEKKKIKFIAPQMPNTESPRMDEWIAKLQETVGELDDQTGFVGYSVGCQTIIRYLSYIKEDVVVDKIVFVAPWTKLDQLSIEEEGEESVKIVESWVNVPIDFEEAKSHMNKVLAIFSTDDPYVPLSNTKIFEKKLNAKVIIKENEEHFTEIKEIKEIMKFIGK